jgi:hypothetical protein
LEKKEEIKDNGNAMVGVAISPILQRLSDSQTIQMVSSG